MIRKLFVTMLIIAAGLSVTACWEEALGFDYVCSGAGTCESPKVCCNLYDCYYKADGETFYCDDLDCVEAQEDYQDYCWDY